MLGINVGVTGDSGNLQWKKMSYRMALGIGAVRLYRRRALLP